MADKFKAEADNAPRPTRLYLYGHDFAFLNERRYRTGASFSATIREALDDLKQKEAKKRKR